MILGSCRSTSHSRAMLKLLLRSFSKYESCHCYTSLWNLHSAVHMSSYKQDVLFNIGPADFFENRAV